MNRPDLGDGDPCAVDPEHGRMFFVDAAKTKQWCPHSAHRGNPFYARDGKTPARWYSSDEQLAQPR